MTEVAGLGGLGGGDLFVFDICANARTVLGGFSGFARSRASGDPISFQMAAVRGDSASFEISVLFRGVAAAAPASSELFRFLFWADFCSMAFLFCAMFVDASTLRQNPKSWKATLREMVVILTMKLALYIIIVTICGVRAFVSKRIPKCRQVTGVSCSRLLEMKVAVVGAGFGGWGAVKSLVEAGQEVVLIDTLPDPTGASPFTTPSGKPFEAGTKGFWKDYPNIYKMLADMNIQQGDIFTPCTNSSFFSPDGLEATAPVFGDSLELPSPLGQVFASAKLFKRLPLKDRASMVGLLAAMIDYDRDEETLMKYDRMSAHDLFVRFGLSKRLVDDFIRPTLLVGLFKPPEELSAAVTMELLYFYALAHQTSFDVKWMRKKSIAECVIRPLADRLQNEFPDRLTIVGSSRVTRVNVDERGGKVTSLEYSSIDGSEGAVEGLDGVVLALGNKGMSSVVNSSPQLSKRSPELSRAASLKGIDCIAVRLWLDKKISTDTPANVFSRFADLRGAGGTFFMLDQLHGDPAYGGTEEDEEALWGGADKQGSVVACDFYNAGALLGLSDEDVVSTLLGEGGGGLLGKAVPAFAEAKVVDSYVLRCPGAVSWFSPGSYVSRPPLIPPNFDGTLVCAGDWVRMGERETRAKGLCQERAFICGLEAGNAILRRLGHADKLHEVLEIRDDEVQVKLGRRVNSAVQGLLKPVGLDSFWVR